MDSGFIPVGVRRFESGPPHTHIELLYFYFQITSRVSTFRNTGSLEISGTLRDKASAAINVSCSSGIARDRKMSYPSSGKLDWKINEDPLSSSRT